MKKPKRSLYFTDRKKYWEQDADLKMRIEAARRAYQEADLESERDTNLIPPEDYALAEDWQTLDQLAEWTSVEAGDPLPTRTAQSILLEAAEIVAGNRATLHGPKERSFALIAAFWEVYLTGRKEGRDAPVTAVDVAQMQVLLKIARQCQGAGNLDNFTDQAGYSGTGGEIWLAMKGSSHGPE